MSRWLLATVSVDVTDRTSHPEIMPTPVADLFADKPDALEWALEEFVKGRFVSNIRSDLRAKYGIKITYKTLSERLQRIATRRAVKLAEETPTKSEERSELTTAATTALAGQGAEPLRRRKRLLQRAEIVWKCLTPSAKNSPRLYIALEEMALKYLALQFRVAQVTGDGDALAEATETLRIKVSAILTKVAQLPKAEDKPQRHFDA